MKAVLMDVGGVLVVPRPGTLAGVVAPHGGITDPDEIIRVHYAAMTAADSDHGFDWDRYHAELLDGCRVPVSARAACDDDMAEMERVTPDLWSHPLPGVRGALRSLAGQYRLGIVSNSNGTVRSLMAELDLCQQGPGPATEVDVIVDSAVVGVEKPDPSIFAFAMEILGLSPDEVSYVGDTRAFDVAGARAAGLRPIHLDPYGFCAGDDHEHITGIADLVTTSP